MYPREYNTFQDTVEKARIGELPSGQEFVIQIENLAEWKELLGSNGFPEVMRNLPARGQVPHDRWRWSQEHTVPDFNATDYGPRVKRYPGVDK
jgi:hypothetical protein